MLEQVEQLPQALHVGGQVFHIQQVAFPGNDAGLGVPGQGLVAGVQSGRHQGLHVLVQLLQLLLHPGADLAEIQARKVLVQVIGGFHQLRRGIGLGRKQDTVLHVPVAGDQDQQDAFFGKAEKLDLADLRGGAPGGGDDAGEMGQLGEKLGGIGDQLLGMAGAQGVPDLDDLVLFQGAHGEQAVYEQPIAPGRGNPAGGGVGAGDEAGFFQVRHDVADGGGGQLQAGKPGQGPGAHGGTLGDVVLDQGLEQGAGTVVKHAADCTAGQAGRAAGAGFVLKFGSMNFPFHSLLNPRTIALVGKYQSREVGDALIMLAEYLHERGVVVFIERETAENMGRGEALSRWMVCGFNDIGAHADLAIVLGGDGTMLNAARRLARYKVPLVGVNQGRLGFMTDIARQDMLTCMEDLLDGRFQPESRMLLDAEVIREGREITSNVALNDIVVDKGAIGRMIEFELFINGEFIYNLRSDGLIVSTPTGSTAYALSANGPILHPTLTGIALVPLCPHALTNRPVIVDDRVEIELIINHADDPRVHFDGQLTLNLQRGDAIRLRRSEYSICFLHPPGYSYFAMLRQKLQWSERPKGT